MDWKLELVVVPVTDVDRAKAFYADQLGFLVDVDTSPSEDVRIVQLTPPGSACSIMVGKGVGEGVPGSLQGLQICVGDIEAAHAQLVERGVDVTPIRHMGRGGLGGRQGRRLQLLRLLQRPGRQQLGRPGESDHAGRASAGMTDGA